MVAALALGFSAAGAADSHRASINYMVHCQGCHLPKGAGTPGRVPRLADSLGHFLHSKDGRRFVVQVPGVSTSRLPDDELSELLNWLLVTYSSKDLPDPFEPFTAPEVAELRVQPEMDVNNRREKVLQDIAASKPDLAANIQQGY